MDKMKPEDKAADKAEEAARTARAAGLRQHFTDIGLGKVSHPPSPQRFTDDAAEETAAASRKKGRD